MTPQNLLTIAEVADRLAVSVRTVRRLIAAGDLTAVDVSAGGGRPAWRVAGDDLTAFLRSRAA